MNDPTPVRAEDLLPVGSRVSWAAVFAGSVIALALYFLMTLVGSAIGLSVHDRVRPFNVGTAAAIWAVLSMVVALFVGGYITSQLTVGENKTEAAIHGVIMWGVLFGMLLWLMASGVRSGFNAMVGMAQAGVATTGDTVINNWEAGAQRAGVPQATIAEWKQKAADDSDANARKAEDARNLQIDEETAARVTWWAVLGTVLSMAAAVIGALAGAGPTFRLIAVGVPFQRRNIGRHEPVL